MSNGFEFRGGWVLGTRAAGALGRILVDRFEEAFGRALPRTAPQLVQLDVVNELIRKHAPDGGTRLPPLRAIRNPGIDFESSNCTNFLIDVQFELKGEFNGEGPQTDPLPKTMYVKLPCAQLATRAFANTVGFWEVEAVFCERVAARVPIRVPRVYAVARRGARFVLLLENLQEIPGAKMFINRDMAAGTTLERARMCIRTFAELHATFWGHPDAEREVLLPKRLHPYLAPGGSEMTRALNAAAITPARKAAPDIFKKEHVELCRLAIEKWDALIEAWYSEPLTLIHGDSHLANCFEYPSPDGPRIGMLDFQGLQWCKGIRDLQYFLINSLEPEVLAPSEGRLIDFYIGALSRRGVVLSSEDAHAQYRAFSFQTLMVAVVSIGLGSLTERSETLRTVLRRSVAAIERLGFGDWLEEL